MSSKRYRVIMFGRKAGEFDTEHGAQDFAQRLADEKHQRIIIQRHIRRAILDKPAEPYKEWVVIPKKPRPKPVAMAPEPEVVQHAMDLGVPATPPATRRRIVDSAWN